MERSVNCVIADASVLRPDDLHRGKGEGPHDACTARKQMNKNQSKGCLVHSNSVNSRVHLGVFAALHILRRQISYLSEFEV